jgi:16S rRNA (cytosine1402-N4)-methyltransferase
MLEECMNMLAPAGQGRSPRVFVDATFGAGGHTRAILETLPDVRVVALDADPGAIARGRALAELYPGRLFLHHVNFAHLDAALASAGESGIDAILYDLGLSSLQLADPQRGFSFGAAEEAPLDMRLDPTSGQATASELLQRLSEADLEAALRTYGDERHARAIARTIVRRRDRIRSWTSRELVAAVMSAQPRGRRRSRIHPATRTFQALRMLVNDDLSNLERSLDIAVRRLRPGGRAVVISFHSGEDRVVKRRFAAFARMGLATLVTRKPLRPSPREVAANPRSRSAKLRALTRPHALQEGEDAA